MNRQPTREEIQRYLQRWHQLKQQYGDQAVNMPEFNQLTKIIRYIQAQAMQQRQQQSQGSQSLMQLPPQQAQQQQQQQGVQQSQNVQQQNLQQSVQNVQQMKQPYMQMNNGLGKSTNGNLGGAGAQSNLQNAQLSGMMGSQQSPLTQTSMHMPQNYQNMGALSVSHTQSMPQNGLQNGMNFGGESPFTAQQLQLLKLQNQAVKFLFKNPGGGFPPIPQNVIEMATSERLALAGASQAPTPGMSGLPVQPAPGSGQIPLQSPQSSFQQAPTPSNMQRGAMPMQVPPLQVGTPQQSSMSSLDRMDPKKAQPKRLSQSKSLVDTPKAGLVVDPNVTQPVTRPAQPPVEFTEFSEGQDFSKQLVVPISKPNAQVDTYEYPQILDPDAKDILYNSLYSALSRITCPSLFPEGIDIDDIMSTRESLVLLQIDARVQTLRKKLEQTSDDEEKNNALIELAQYQLLPYQKQIRGRVLSQVWFSKSLLPNSHPNFLAKFGNLTVDNVVATEELYKQQLYSLVQAQNRKHQDTVSRILNFKAIKQDKKATRKERLDRLAMRINSYHSQTQKEEQKKLERMAKQRLQALKLNDEEAYLKLLDHTKDTRITHLLKQTNQFLDSLALAVQTQQRDARDKYAPEGPQDTEPLTEEKREKMDYYHVAHRIKEEVTKQPDLLIGGTLKEYQIKGLQWMVSLFNNHLNGILADEMGLGKTIQTISLLTYLVEVKKIRGPFLVIVPLSTLTNWNIEFEKWAPGLRKITYKGTPVQRKVMQNDVRLGNFQVLLTTFEYIIKDKALLSKIRWVHMIIDEGHRMKNANSKLSETLTHFYHSDYRLILTGTPLQNNLPELWALLNFVLPKIFNSVKSFDEWFNTPFANTGGQDKIELSEEETLLVIRRLHKVLRPFLLRRLKKDVEKDLPNKVEKVVKCKMSNLQSKLYRMMLKYNMLYASDSFGSDVPIPIKNANNQLMQLRKICNHPFVYEDVEKLINPMRETNDNIWRVAGKFELLDRILPKFKRTGHRVLIFFQMTQIMDIVEDFLSLRGLKYMRLDGGTKSDDRTILLNLFNEPNSEYFCFLLSTRAGGLGLNLQTADTVIIFDSDWNPHQDLQAQDRAHRIGQKNEVRILRLITEDSIEEMILERAVAKLEIDGKVIQAGKFDNKSTAEEQEALLRALLEKEEERRHKGVEDEDDLDDDELNQVIARTDAELELFREMDEERIAATRSSSQTSRLFTEQELPAIYQVDPQTFCKTDEQIIEEYGRGNRERKRTVYDDNMTEEEWLKKIDGVESEDSDDESLSKKKARRRNSPGLDDPFSKRARSSTPGGRPKGRSRVVRPKLKTSSNRSTPTVDVLTPEYRDVLQNNMEIIYGSILDYTDSDRRLSDMFLIKPSKKLYPDYYVLIKHPLALDTIKKRMGNRTYSNIREFLEDIHLIFSNARIYNEEGSIVYQDALALENLSASKFKELYPNTTDEEFAKMFDFREFDAVHLLKPLAVGSAVKQPIDIMPPSNTEDTTDLTPFFDLKELADI